MRTGEGTGAPREVGEGIITQELKGALGVDKG